MARRVTESQLFRRVGHILVSSFDLDSALGSILDEALAEQEGDFDADSRFALTWFEQHGFGEGPAGEAILLSTAKATALNGLEQAGIIKSGRGNVRLLRPEELDRDYILSADFLHLEGMHPEAALQAAIPGLMEMLRADVINDGTDSGDGGGSLPTVMLEAVRTVQMMLA